MARLTKKLFNKAIGGNDPLDEGIRRSLRGLRVGDRRELYLGLSLSALAYLSRTRPSRRLLYRQKVPAGSAVVVHHKKRGAPSIEVIRPDDL